MTLIAVIVSSEGAFLFSDTLISIGESNPTRSLPKLSVHNDLLANKVQVFGNTVVGYSGIVSSIINAAEAVETRFNAGKDFKPTPRAISEIVQDTSFGKPDNEHVNCLSLQINKLASTDLSIGFSAYGKVVQEVIAEGWAVISIGSGAREFATEAQDHAKEIAYTGVKPTDSVFAQHMSVGLVGRLNGEFITGGYTYPRNAWGGLLEIWYFDTESDKFVGTPLWIYRQVRAYSIWEGNFGVEWYPFFYVHAGIEEGSIICRMEQADSDNYQTRFRFVPKFGGRPDIAEDEVYKALAPRTPQNQTILIEFSSGQGISQLVRTTTNPDENMKFFNFEHHGDKIIVGGERSQFVFQMITDALASELEQLVDRNTLLKMYD